MNRWRKKILGTLLFALGALVVVGAGGTMMLEASTGYAGSQTGFGQTLLAVVIGSAFMLIGATTRKSAIRKSRKTFYLGGLSRLR